MSSYVIRRCLGIGANLLLVSLLLFFAVRLIPGDITLTILTESSTEEQREAFRKQHGLDKGALGQYVDWATGVMSGDFGSSFRSNLSVNSEFLSRLPVTLEIVVLSFTFTSIFGVTGGILAAIKQDTLWDHGVRITAILGISIPSFLLLTLMLIIPARIASYSPPFGATRILEDPVTNLQLFIPPTLILAIGGSATLMRLTRTAMLDVLRQDYLRTARAKGLRELDVVWRHAARNALPTVMTLMGLQLGFLLSGSIVLESVMALPGVGSWALTAIQTKDYPIIMMFALYSALVLMIITLIVDLAYAWLDPRVRYA